jgi:septum formation protein
MAELTLILASASPRRSQLLAEMGVTFQVIPGNLEEAEPPFLTPVEITLRNAHGKAKSVAVRHPGELVLGADTVVCLGNTVFGKPHNFDEARGMLGQLQGKTHQVITGVCLLRWKPFCQRLFAVSTTVHFKKLPSAQIDHYLELIQPLDKAGAYAAQEHGGLIIEKIEGSYSNVVGLPVEKLREELAAWHGPPKSAEMQPAMPAPG